MRLTAHDRASAGLPGTSACFTVFPGSLRASRVGYYSGRPAATGPVTGRAASSLRSGTSRAMPCVVGDV